MRKRNYLKMPVLLSAVALLAILFSATTVSAAITGFVTGDKITNITNTITNCCRFLR